MSIFVGQLVFNGPFLDAEEIKEAEGVYVILSEEKGLEINSPVEFGVTKLGHAKNLKAEIQGSGLTGDGEPVNTSFAAVIYAHECPDVTIDTVALIFNMAA